MDAEATHYELIGIMVVSDNVLGVERIRRKIVNKSDKTVTECATHVIGMTREGNCVPREIQIYDGITSLKVRPYVENVLQCFGCYKFGHLAKYYRAKPFCCIATVCIACGEEFHGKCDKPWRCVNCGDGHKPTDKRCEVFKFNQEIKRTMVKNVRKRRK